MEDPRCPKRNRNLRIKTEPACHGLTAGSDATVYVQLLYTYISNCDRLGFNVEIQIYIGTVQVHISFAKEKVCHLDNRYQKNGQVSRNKYFPLLISQNHTIVGAKSNISYIYYRRGKIVILVANGHTWLLYYYYY